MPDGLDGIIAASTRISSVEGEAGRLTLAGYAVEDLAPHASFEEVAYLLLHGHLPAPAERLAFSRGLAERRVLSGAVLDVLRAAAAAETPPMDALRMAAPLLSLGRAEDPLREALTAIASFPTIVGSYWRLRHGERPAALRHRHQRRVPYRAPAAGAGTAAGTVQRDVCHGRVLGCDLGTAIIDLIAPLSRFEDCITQLDVRFQPRGAHSRQEDRGAVRYLQRAQRARRKIAPERRSDVRVSRDERRVNGNPGKILTRDAGAEAVPAVRRRHSA